MEFESEATPANLHQSASVSDNGGNANPASLARDFTADIPLTVAPGGFSCPGT